MSDSTAASPRSQCADEHDDLLRSATQLAPAPPGDSPPAAAAPALPAQPPRQRSPRAPPIDASGPHHFSSIDFRAADSHACTPSTATRIECEFTLHGDAVPAATADAAFRSVSRALLPIFFLLHCLNFIDRTNVSFAAAPLAQDLGLTQRQFGAVSTAFFFGYCAFQVPSQMMLRRFGAPLWLATVATVWGVVAMCMAAATDARFFYAARLVLGVAEAGALPGSWFYLTTFYPNNRITLPFAVIDSAIMFAHVVGSPLAAGLLAMDGVGGLAGWRWLFLLEGIPAALLGVALFRLLPAAPGAAAFLTPEQGRAVQAEVDSDRGGGAEDDGGFRASAALLASGLRSRALWHIAAIKFLKAVAAYGTILWTPILIKAILDSGATQGDACLSWADAKAAHGQAAGGHTHTWAVLLTGIPFALATCSGVYVAHRSQVRGERVKHFAVPCFAAGAVLVALPAMLRLHAALGLVGLMTVIVVMESVNGVLVSLASSALAGPGLAIELALLNSVANGGGVVGPFFVGLVGQSTCSYDTAFLALGGTLLGAAGLALLLRDDAGGRRKRVRAGTRPDGPGIYELVVEDRHLACTPADKPVNS